MAEGGLCNLAANITSEGDADRIVPWLLAQRLPGRRPREV